MQLASSGGTTDLVAQGFNLGGNKHKATYPQGLVRHFFNGINSIDTIPVVYGDGINSIATTSVVPTELAHRN